MIPMAAVSRHPYGFLIVRLGATVDGAQVRFNIQLREAAGTRAKLADPLTRNSDVQLRRSRLVGEYDLATAQVWIWRSALYSILRRDNVCADQERHPDFGGSKGFRERRAGVGNMK